MLKLEVGLPDDDWQVVASDRDQVAIIRSEPQPGDLAWMVLVLFKEGIGLDCRVWEQVNSSLGISWDHELLVNGPAHRDHI